MNVKDETKMKKGEKATEQFLIEILDRGILDMREFGSLVNILAEEDGGTKGECGCRGDCGCWSACRGCENGIFDPWKGEKEDPGYISHELRKVVGKIISEYNLE